MISLSEPDQAGRSVQAGEACSSARLRLQASPQRSFHSDVISAFLPPFRQICGGKSPGNFADAPWACLASPLGALRRRGVQLGNIFGLGLSRIAGLQS